MSVAKMLPLKKPQGKRTDYEIIKLLYQSHIKTLIKLLQEVLPLKYLFD